MTVEVLNLPPSPPGFRGLRPDLPIKTYHRRLPHWRQKGATYFVTFRLADSLPQAKLEQLRQWREQWERTHPEPRLDAAWKEFAREHFRLAEGWMDEGHGECVFRSQELAKILSDALLYFQGQRYLVSCFVVMPNHCHVVVRPDGERELEQILDSWKGYVAHEVNRRLGRRSSLWQEESYDRIVRDDEHLFRVVQYIGRNPRTDERWRRWIHADWEQLGWGFRDVEGVT